MIIKQSFLCLIFIVFLSNSFALSKEDKQELLHFFWDKKNTIQNIDLINYIDNLAAKIYPDKKFKLFVIRDNEINAFATEDNFIAINSGLILHTNTESELASVIAHEIAHINLKHSDRMSTKMQNYNYLALGGILLSAITGNTTVGLANIAFTLQKNITFTKEYEIEADNYAKSILQKTNFNDNAMSNFFARLKSSGIDDFLTTHPLPVDRASDSFMAFNNKKTPSSFNYLVIKAQIKYKLDKKLAEYNNKELGNYMHAWVLFNNKKYQEVINLLKTSNNNISKILLARTYANLGDINNAVKYLTTDNSLNKYYLAKAYFINNKLDIGIKILRQQNYKTPTIYNYNLLKSLYLKNNQIDRFHLINAEINLLTGNNKKALKQLELAKINTNDSDLLAIINYKIDKIK